jgi:hypothetical protein
MSQLNMNKSRFQLIRDAFGRLVLITQGRVFESVVPVRAYPIQSGAAEALLWCTPMAMSGVAGQLADAAADSGAHSGGDWTREFMPEILDGSVTSFSTLHLARQD